MHLTPETEIVLCCTRTVLDDGTREHLLNCLKSKFYWTDVLKIALRHRLLPLVYTHLIKFCSDTIPTKVLNQFRDLFLANSLHNEMLTRELLDIVMHFKNHGIVTIPYKGPLLAHEIYGDVSLRQFADLDLLIHAQDGAQARLLLLSHDYQWRSPSVRLNRFRQVDEMMRSDGQVLVELHHAITSWTFFVPYPLDQVWEKAELIDIDHTPVYTMALDDLLLVLCIHGAKHHWQRLSWICDIAELLRHRHNIDWDQLVNKARKCGCSRMLGLGLYLAHVCLNADLPEEIRPWIQHQPHVHMLGHQVIRHLFVDRESEMKAVHRSSFYLALRERARDKARCGIYLAYRALRPRRS